MLFVIQNSNFTTLLVGDASVGAAECGSEALASPPPVPPPFFPGSDNPRPECQPAPSCPTQAQLDALSLTISFTPVSPKDATGMVLPDREIRVKPVLTNTGKASISLAGVAIPVKYNHQVLVPAFDEWTDAGGDEYSYQCW